MLRIRLKRVGRKNNPSFRVVLVESQKGPQTGKINENLGFYYPKTNTTKIEAERVKYWIENGAQVSDTVHNILINEKIIEGKKINVLPQKSPVVKEEKEEAKTAEESSPKEEKTEEASADTEGSDEVKEEPKEGEKSAEEKRQPEAEQPTVEADEAK